ncbi:MAG: Exodeoxyribonuclease III [Candidatus Midichloria mitochondrii]|uniref:Exodeoxyribonuclease III n=1 Tax=Midichloria mitochondrii (strain IricVA) TaxID=696127 RepID=F7XVT4_MIDMI|nr:exodeoxyribonuclease III [Candidatus Midichloria mitochondrii]AEI88783.1 exodeoxyribonuclease III [Candidatus Midichloria mitochondrii IricVA]MDJ1256105.1 exodeoxyribonuclease III [Candidatus Midichloria mitochondrii]MDJ1287801.1 exodeoxyribonuclease III [Candidatus Midichloria mitochondrii]MDJ1298640.1 exodeoxyribonuclease III [Candidatus Midichloria mitochondrii]MDJ1312569.1 exodeoxyribonuclease III [Candidatus Midichloria mitochondrii]
MALIVSWNVNSINARIHHLRRFLAEKKPEIVLLQETKCQAEKFPFEALEEFNYNIKVYGQKSYNGVAILSKSPIEDSILGLPTLSEDWPPEARYIEAFTTINNYPLRVISVYVPNGLEVGSHRFLYKLEFLHALKQHLIHLSKAEENIIVGGDLNVAPEEIDVYNPKGLDGSICFHIKERSQFRGVINSGFIDTFRAMNPGIQEFSWWDYRGNGYIQNRGMRIDHILVSPNVSDMMSEAEIFKEARGWERASDHVPVLCKLGN